MSLDGTVRTKAGKAAKRFFSAAAAVSLGVLLLYARIDPAFAYFTTYAVARGGYTFGDVTTVKEEYADWVKDVRIVSGRTEGEEADGYVDGSTPLYVRVKAVTRSDYQQFLTYQPEKAGDWTEGESGWWYFTRPLAGVDETTVLHIALTEHPAEEKDAQSFNIIVVYEEIPAEAGTGYAEAWAAADLEGGTA